MDSHDQQDEGSIWVPQSELQGKGSPRVWLTPGSRQDGAGAYHSFSALSALIPFAARLRLLFVVGFPIWHLTCVVWSFVNLGPEREL